MKPIDLSSPILLKQIEQWEADAKAAELARRDAERAGLLARYGASLDEQARVLPALAKECAAAEATFTRARDALDTARMRHYIAAERIHGEQHRWMDQLAERPSPAQRDALARLTAELAGERGRILPPPLRGDHDRRVAGLGNVIDQIAALAVVPDAEHPARIAAIEATLPARVADGPTPLPERPNPVKAVLTAAREWIGQQQAEQANELARSRVSSGRY